MNDKQKQLREARAAICELREAKISMLNAASTFNMCATLFSDDKALRQLMQAGSHASESAASVAAVAIRGLTEAASNLIDKLQAEED